MRNVLNIPTLISEDNVPTLISEAESAFPHAYGWMCISPHLISVGKFFPHNTYLSVGMYFCFTYKRG